MRNVARVEKTYKVYLTATHPHIAIRGELVLGSNASRGREQTGQRSRTISNTSGTKAEGL